MRVMSCEKYADGMVGGEFVGQDFASPQGLKPESLAGEDARAKARTLQTDIPRGLKPSSSGPALWHD